MKKYLEIILIILAIPLFTAFDKQKEESLSQRITLNNRWMLIRMSDDNSIVNKKIYLDWTDKKNPALVTDCSDIRLNIQTSRKGSIRVKNIYPIQDNCEEEWEEIQTQVIGYLQNAKSYILHGKYLIIQTNESKELMFAVSKDDTK